MTVTFRPAKREGAPLLLGLAGSSGSGKTYSALQLAKGMAGGARFAMIDSENGRAKHYADVFEFDHADIRAPFRPQAYADAIEAADAAGYPVVVVDSASHEWYGDGGCLDWHDDLMGGDQKKNLSAWILPKREHKRMVTRLLQVRAHVILCLRAEEKVEAVRGERGIEIKPKQSLVGLDGWIPIAEKNLPYELTASFLLLADKPGVPKPIKLPEQLRGLVPLDKPLTPMVGAALAEWARGGVAAAAPVDHEIPFVAGDDPDVAPEMASEAQRRRLFAIASERGVDKDALKAVLLEVTGQESSAAIPREKYDLVVDAVQRVAA